MRAVKSWPEIFCTRTNKSPHSDLIDVLLCPRTEHQALSLPNERPFWAHKVECGNGTCQHCGINRLPWDCPMVCENKTSVKVWVWEKDEAGKERTFSVRKTIQEIAILLREALEKYVPHYVRIVYSNRMMYLSMQKLSMTRLHWRTDFSAMMDFVPIRKINCHINTHGVLCIWTVNFKKKESLKSGEEITVMHSEDWIGFGSAEGKGKQNDWVFSNAFKRYILKHYNGAEPQIDEHEGVTDGCRGQVSCFARLLASYDKQALLTLLFSTCEVS